MRVQSTVWVRSRVWVRAELGLGLGVKSGLGLGVKGSELGLGLWDLGSGVRV